jgi:hypothetical protein
MALANGYFIYVKNSQGEALTGYYDDLFDLIANVEGEQLICQRLHDVITGGIHVSYRDFILFVIFECEKKAADKFMSFIKYYVEVSSSQKGCDWDDLHSKLLEVLYPGLEQQIAEMFELFKASLK